MKGRVLPLPPSYSLFLSHSFAVSLLESQSRLRSNEECVDTTVIGRPSEVDRQRDGRKVAEWIDKVSCERYDDIDEGRR